MKIIALKGGEDSGKSKTLRIVYSLFKELGGNPITGHFKYLKGNSKDFRDVLNLEGKIIGIVTQGDYGKKLIKPGCDVETMTAFSVGEHLEALDKAHCDVAICAWTDKEKNVEKQIEKDIKKYPTYEIVTKTKIESKDVILQLEDNTHKAMEIIKILNDWLSNATE